MQHRFWLLISIVTVGISCCAQVNTYGGSDYARGFTTSLTGTVHDSSDRPVSGARIEVIDPVSGHAVANVFTLVNGTFQIDNLRQGVYELVASSGVTESRIRLQFDEDRDVSIRLPINSNPPEGSSSSVSLSQMKVPGKARRMFEKAEEAFSKARIKEAFDFVEKALGAYPDYAKALTLRGILHMQQGDTKDAQPDLEKAVQLDYGDDLGFIALASLYNNEGQFDRAQMTLDHGMTLNPKSWQANLEMARSELGKKDYGAAVRSLDRAASFAPPVVTVTHLYRAQALVGLKDYKAAISELETYLNQSPNDVNSGNAREMLARLQEYTATAK